VIKGVEGHPRVENERDVLTRLQHRSPFLRPMIDEIEDPNTPTTIAMRYLDSELLTENQRRILNRKELKHVCRSVLEALRILHEENLVHTGMSKRTPDVDASLIWIEDVKLDNVFANIQEDADDRFSEVQLGDLGGCYPADSKWATSGTMVGTPMWTSPEMLMETPWNTASDIWSFGAMVSFAIHLCGCFSLHTYMC
jgi:serine/threonine protein kinase